MKRITKKLLNASGYPEAEACLVFTDDEEIAELNSRWRGKDLATDVLSFPTNAEPTLGDIVISVETAARQAKELKVSLAEELLRLFIHGFLHLLGFDHQDEKDAVAMDKKEQELFDIVGELIEEC